MYTIVQLRDDIASVVNYNWQAEVRDYEENPGEGHVLLPLRRLSTFLGEQEGPLPGTCIHKTWMYGGANDVTASAGESDLTYEEFVWDHIQDEEAAFTIATDMLDHDGHPHANYSEHDGCFEHYIVTDPDTLRAALASRRNPR